MARCEGFPPRRPRTPSPCSSDNASLTTYLDNSDLMVQYDSYLKFEAARKRVKRSKGKGVFFFSPRSEESFSFDESSTMNTEPTSTTLDESTWNEQGSFDESSAGGTPEPSESYTTMDSQNYSIDHSTPNKDEETQFDQFGNEILSPVFGTTSTRRETNLAKLETKRKLDLDQPLQGKSKPQCVCNRLICICTHL